MTSDARDHAPIEHPPVGVLVADASGALTAVDATAARLLGSTPRELVGRALEEIVAPEDRARVAELRRGRVDASAWSLLRADGANIPVDLHARVADDGALQIFVFAHTASAEIERALRLSEGRLAGLLEVAADAILVVDAEQRIVLFNRAAERIFGWSKEEVLNTSLDRLLPDTSRGRHRELVAGFIRGPSEVRRMGERGAVVRGRRKDGSEFPADAAISVLDTPQGRLGTAVLRDISEQRRIEVDRARLAASLEAERMFLRTILDHLQTGILAFDGRGQIVTHNVRAAEILGVDPRLGWDVVARLVESPDGSVDLAALPSRRALEGKTVHQAPLRVILPSGDVRDVSSSATPVRDAEGAIVGAVVHLEDVTEQRRREQRVALLARAGTPLSAAADRAEIVTTLLAHCVPEVADGCLLSARVDGRFVQIASACSDARRGAELAAWVESERASGRPAALPELALTVVVPRVGGATHPLVEASPEMEALRAIGARSAVVVPLIAHAETMGALTLFSLVEGRRQTDPADVEMMEALAHVVALTLQRHELLERAKLDAQRLEAALASMEDAVALFDHEQRLVLANQPYRALFRSLGDASPLEGRLYAELVAASLVGLRFDAEDDRAQLLERGLDARVANARTSDGRSLRFQARKSASGWVQTVWDLSSDARREDELRAARRDAESASEAKSQFLASMSHELRTPLNAVLGFAELLQRDRLDPLSTRHKERVERILRSGEHLRRLIDDVLDLSRIEAGGVSLAFEEVHVVELVGEVAASLAPTATAASVTIVTASSPELGPVVVADRVRYAQILLNLASNAIKYNRAGGRVSLVVSEPAPRVVRVTVEDDGPGIARDKQARLFQPFERAGQETGNIEGTGIGLVISKRLAERMRGSVGFSSEVGVGSSFWVDLPSA